MRSEGWAIRIAQRFVIGRSELKQTLPKEV